MRVKPFIQPFRTPGFRVIWLMQRGNLTSQKWENGWRLTGIDFRFGFSGKLPTFAFPIAFVVGFLVSVVQLVRTSDCDSEGRGFESHRPPVK